MKSIKETGMKFVFLAAACTSVLAVALICIFLFGKRNSGNGEDWPARFPVWNEMETIQWTVWNFSIHSWKYLCNSRGHCGGSSNSPSACNLPCILLSEKAVCTIKGNGKPPCRNPICCLWIFRFDSVCPAASTAYRS